MIGKEKSEGLNLGLPRFRLFILGSGFSKPAGHPLGMELLKMVRSRMRSFYQSYQWDGPFEKDIAEWKKLYPGEEVSLESVFAYSHRKHFLKLIGSEEYFSHASRSIVTARQMIQEILSVPINPEAQELYTEFCSKLCPTDLVLTFNYDTVLEDTLESLNKPYSLVPEWWLERESTQKDSRNYPAKFVDILKLHGSIDWYDRYYYDESREYYKKEKYDVPDKDPLFGSNANVPIEPLTRGRLKGGYGDEIVSRIFRVPNHQKYFPFQSRSHSEVPFILPPAFDKLLGHDPIRELWSNMHRTFDAFSVITIIGYSMPRYDGYAYEALGKILINYQEGGEKNQFEHSRVPIQIVTKASSKEDVFSNLPFLDRNLTRVWNDGFSQKAIKWINWGE